MAKQKKRKSNAGRRSKYNPNTFPLLAEGYARDGLNDEQIAKNLGIHKSTFYDYQQKFPEFSDAIIRGKAPVDIQVENMFLKRCMGYEYEEETRKMGLDKDGNPVVKEIVRIKKHIPGSVHAQETWMKNRMPDKWREKQHIEHSGAVQTGDIEIGYFDMHEDD